MKYLILFIALIPLAAFAQDCAIKKERDQFTQQDRLTTGFLQLTNAKVSITADSKDIDFFFSLAPDKCFDENSTLTVLYDDGRTKNNFRSSGSMNCEGLYHFSIRNTPTTNYNLDRMGTKKIKSITLTNDKTVTVITFNEQQQQLMQTAARCIATEAKTLLPKPGL